MRCRRPKPSNFAAICFRSASDGTNTSRRGIPGGDQESHHRVRLARAGRHHHGCGFFAAGRPMSERGVNSSQLRNAQPWCRAIVGALQKLEGICVRCESLLRRGNRHISDRFEVRGVGQSGTEDRSRQLQRDLVARKAPYGFDHRDLLAATELDSCSIVIAQESPGLLGEQQLSSHISINRCGGAVAGGDSNLNGTRIGNHSRSLNRSKDDKWSLARDADFATAGRSAMRRAFPDQALNLCVR